MATLIVTLTRDPEIAEQVATHLDGPRREVCTVQSLSEARGVLDEGAVSLLIVDVGLPGGRGIGFIREIRQDSAFPFLPVIAVGRDVAYASDCYAWGADTFLVLPEAIESVRDASATYLRRASATLGTESRDPLTGLGTRASLHGRIRALSESRPDDTPVSLAILELDHFKHVNAQFGRRFGDLVLKEMATRLVDSLPSPDVAARWTGAEFLVLLEGLDRAAASELMDRVLAEARSQAVKAPDGEPFHLTFTAGVEQWEGGVPFEDVLMSAEEHLHAASAAGGNLVLNETRVSGMTSDPRVLIAEDDPLTAALLTHLLEREGCEVVHYESGRAAYDDLLATPATLVITDVRMPGMDGFELVEKLRKAPGYARTPIIVLSSMGREEDIVRGFQLGASDYLAKPFSRDELWARVLRFLPRKAAGGPSWRAS